MGIGVTNMGIRITNMEIGITNMGIGVTNVVQIRFISRLKLGCRLGQFSLRTCPNL